ncbi:KxYKxGKxW signal peptide domain-containing protein [Streptococcus halichoeri]|uniref:KxYKxGKxW signal peptide domain-containing protein n=1 Tax=Streptococcus halichoeri TaxID=254785 RepID=UPI00135C3D2D|nr:KxYKxGKxW signal peptide domain-containing protein [Streptococcus halichoeri]
MEKRESTKIGFRMWKSGKRWLFSGIALAATLMIGTSAISADVNVDGALTDHKDICLKVHDLHNEDEDKHQCVFWYPGYPEGEMTPPTRPTDDAHPDKEIIGPFGGGSTSTWHGSGYVEETGGRVKPTKPTRPTDDAHPDKEIIGPFGGGSTSTWHGSGYVEETGGRVKPTRPTDDAHPDKEIIGPFGGGSTSTWHGSGYVEETGGRVKPTKPTSEGLQTDEDARRHKSSLPENVVQSKSALTSPVTVLSATGVTTLIAVGAFSIKKIWKK